MTTVFYRAVLAFRNRHLLALDLIAFIVIPIVALLLRTEDLKSIELYSRSLLVYTASSVVWKIGILIPSGMYRRYWRLASVEDLGYLTLALGGIGIAGVLLTGVVLRPFGFLDEFPRSIPYLDAGLTILLLGGTRLGLRLIYYLNERGPMVGGNKRVLIAGAGAGGSMMLKEIRTNPQLRMEPVGFVDDDLKKQGSRIHGVPVLGTSSDLQKLLKAGGIDQVIVAMPSAPGRILREIVARSRAAGVPCQTVPGLFEILDGTAGIRELRDIQIEDLLRRGEITSELLHMQSMVAGRRVLVTGAGGSIGSELCRQILLLDPSALVLLGHGENSIFATESEFRRAGRTTSRVRTIAGTVIADIRDRAMMESVLNAHRPQVVFHAAAHKHVGLMERNAIEAIFNNIDGTRTLLETAVGANVERFVLISSDKAVNPTSIMGVTKRIAELLTTRFAVEQDVPFVSVRFGNVLGSRGSVVPIIKQQIAMGGPVQVSHPDVSRFFMTIPEAVHLVLQAGRMGLPGDLFVLDMGTPIRILDLARDMIRLSGKQEGEEIAIEFTGLLDGEKLEEELYYSFEKPEVTTHEKIMVCHPPVFPKETYSQTSEWVDLLLEKARTGDMASVTATLRRIVPEYLPSSAGDQQRLARTISGSFSGQS